MISKITGAGNPKIKLVKSLLQKKNRIKNGLFTVEGIKSVTDAITAGAPIEMIFVSEEFVENNSVQSISEFNSYEVPKSIFDSLCDTDTPQGILAVIKIKEKKKFVPDKEKLYIYCDMVSDPGNLGTIIRTADAAGLGGVLLSPGCADLYSPKTVRSSMGSFFNIPIYEDIGEEEIVYIKKSGFGFYCGALREDTIPYTDVDFTNPSVIAVGNEANGIRESILKLADKAIKIPILGKAESLNVGIAAAVLMYEAIRQRSN